MKGLSSKEAKKLLEKYGFNELELKTKRTFFSIFFNQYKDAFSIILILAAFLSLVLYFLNVSQDLFDFLLIFAILLINGFLGAYQEYKAEKTLEKLKAMQVSKVKVFRDNKIVEIDSRYIVPGDVVVYEEGDKIIADGEILEGFIKIDESSFTGESYPVIKEKGENVFAGTFVINGKAEVLVKRTGLNTKFGMLTKRFQGLEDISFFREQINDFTAKLVRYIVLIILIFFVVGFFRSHEFIRMLLAAVALGVAVVPEGLAVTTVVTMMNGVRRLVEEKVLVKKLEAVEVLGAIDYVVFDKTGTLTEGALRVKEVVGQELKTKLGYFGIEGSKDWVEKAILAYAKKPKANPILVKPFDYSTRTSALIYRVDGKLIEFVKGAPESVFKLCNEKIDITPWTNMGFRVLAFAVKDPKPRLLGIVAFEDPLRIEAKEAVERMKRAGIKPIMITGDHRATAEYVAAKIGLPKHIISGEEMVKKSDEEIVEFFRNGGIVYRALPTVKLKLVEALQSKGFVVAATGDGVNDVLLLKKAHVGIAMGLRGTDIAKEASDVVLLEDSLLRIVNGILYGRGIIMAVRKFITFLLTCNVTEAISNLFFPFIYFKIPLDAPKLLWINLITDGLPAVSFAFDPLSDELLKAKPKAFRSLLIKPMKLLIFWSGLFQGIIIVLIYFLLLKYYGFLFASTVIFTAIVFSELARIFAVRLLFNEPLFANKVMNYSVLVSIILQIFVVELLTKPFHLVSLGLVGWLFILGWVLVSLTISIIIVLFIQHSLNL